MAPHHEETPGAAAPAVLSTAPPASAPDPERYGVPRLTATWLAGLAVHTRTAYRRDLTHYLAWCAHQGLDPRHARPADLDAYRAGLAHAGRAASTVHRRLAAISSWYHYLAANGEEVATNPLAGVRRPRVARDASATAGLTAEEVRALLRAADAAAATRTGRRGLAAYRDRALVRLLADLGLRVGEALSLDVSALAYNRGRRTLRYHGKGGALRERPVPAPALAAIDDYLAARAAAGLPPTGPLLATAGRDGQPGRLDQPAAFRMVRRLARAAGLPAADRLSPHSLRHAFATNARELGIPLEDVQDAMGHADARTTRRYDRGRHALHRDPALRLGDLYDGPPGEA